MDSPGVGPSREVDPTRSRVQVTQSGVAHRTIGERIQDQLEEFRHEFRSAFLGALEG